MKLRRLGVSPQSVTAFTQLKALRRHRGRTALLPKYGKCILPIMVSSAYSARESIGTLDNLLTSSNKRVVSDMAG
jgi:hypothetical protein